MISPYLQDIENDFFYEDPESLLGRVQATQFINDKLKSVSITSDKNRVELVEVLNIDISRLNNYPVDEVITIIDKEPIC